MKNYLCFAWLLFICTSLFAQEKNDAKTTKWLNLADYDKSATALVQTQKAEWGLSDKISFERKAETLKADKLGFKHYRYAQMYDGIKIEGATWFVHEKNGIAKTALRYIDRHMRLPRQKMNHTLCMSRHGFPAADIG